MTRPTEALQADDRALLEAAARAAGITLDADGDRTDIRDIGGAPLRWNPLTDDGDALRLAVQTGEPFVVRSRCVTTMGGLIEEFDPNVVGDDMRAVRRIIVRAAASLAGSTGAGADAPPL